MTQTLVVHMLRTEHIPFLQSRASLPLLLSTFGAMAVGNIVPYIPGLGKGGFLDMAAVPGSFYGFIVAIVVAYCLLVACVKVAYKRVFGMWL